MIRSQFSSVVLIGLLLLSACSSVSETEPAAVTSDDFAASLSVTGKLVPEVWSVITATGTGQIVDVRAREGDTVARGDVLVQLDDRDAQASVVQAEMALQQARRELDRLTADASEQAIAIAATQVEAARAVLTQTLEQRDQLWAGQLDAQLSAAEAQIAAAQAEQLVARQQHDETMKCHEVTREDGSKQKICPTLGTYEERARAALNAANQQLAAAEAHRDMLKPEHWAQVQTAEAGIQVAEVQVAVAEAQLAQILAGATEDEIAVAEAAVAQAEAALVTAQIGLDHTVVSAPFDGTVGEIEARRGEFATPGTPLVTLGDLSTLRIETTDLDEIDIGRVAVGQAAIVTFDALSDRTFAAEVTRLGPMASTGGGGVNYRAILVLAELDPLLRWGMTAFVDITTE
jgi:HlyD family secretion protein